MKKIAAVFFMFVMAASTAVADIPKIAPGPRTIDMRDYVDWKMPPYNSIVKFEGCTGFIVPGNKIITARHCLFDDRDTTTNKIAGDILFYVYNDNSKGYKFKNYKTGRSNSKETDWAILDATDILSVPSLKLSDSAPSFAQVEVVGFGVLRILNDKEIKSVKDAYADFLNRVTREKHEPRDFYANPRREDIYGLRFKEFLGSSELSGSLGGAGTFTDGFYLKTSKCTISSNNPTEIIRPTSKNINNRGCQRWGGNSGGPVLYKNSTGNWTSVGIAIRGSYWFSDNRHTHANNATLINTLVFKQEYDRFDENAAQQDMKKTLRHEK
jgi:V8-like Glu-specific endopeptidase